jgi:hypothetical protein
VQPYASHAARIDQLGKLSLTPSQTISLAHALYFVLLDDLLKRVTAVRCSRTRCGCMFAARDVNRTASTARPRSVVRFMLNPPKPDREVDQLLVASHSLALATPAAHPLGRVKNLRLRDMTDARFIWFPRRESAAFYDRLMYECFVAA